MASKEKTKALAYLRTSSASNVGTDKRQRAAIAAFAKSHGFQVIEEFCDPGVSGADPIETRPGFTALLDRIEGNGVRTVLVEDASRFASTLLDIGHQSHDRDEFARTEGGPEAMERRLAAIFAADVEGYSRLMAEDEVGTMETLTSHRAILDGLIAEHRGRIANTAGDSVLAEFPSAVDAVCYEPDT